MINPWPCNAHPFDFFIRSALDKISEDFHLDTLYMDDVTEADSYLIYTKLDPMNYDQDEEIFASIPAVEFNSFMNSLIGKYEYYQHTSENKLLIVDEIFEKIMFYHGISHIKR